MAAVVKKRISPASARSHTRKTNRSTSSFLQSGMFWKIALLLLTGTLAWAYQVICPPPSKLCGTEGGPPVTAPRIKLRDGRNLAYKEHGVPKDTAKYHVIFIHGAKSSRNDAVVPSPELVEELSLYIVSFDKPGFGESDPHPLRTVKSLAVDIEELADQLKLHSRFYVMGYSMGGQAVWGCLKYIPHRLAGAALVVPVINYWWPGFPANLSKEGYSKQLPRDQWAVRIAHHAPWLTYWWNTQKWFPANTVVAGHPSMFSRHDREILAKPGKSKPKPTVDEKQQGVFESTLRDIIVGFGNWEFDPMAMEDPFPNKDGTVHLWHGEEDQLVPAVLQRYLAKSLPWIRYHEVEGAGHLLGYDAGISQAIFKSLLLED